MINFQRTKYLREDIPIEVIVGDIKFFASEENEESLNNQINKMYSFGGGWQPFEGFTMNRETKSLKYPEDPELFPLAVAKFRNQEIYIYNYAWVSIVEEDGSFEVARID